ncbi:MAG: hypothetical protein QRY74_05280 [Chlamydia sp.]
MNYSKEFPFLAHICDRYRLSHDLSTKETWHLSVGIDGSEIMYKPGDSLGVLPKNPKALVERTIAYLNLPRDYRIEDPRSAILYRLDSWLLDRVDLSTVSEKLLQGTLQCAISQIEKAILEGLLETYYHSLGPDVDQRESVWHKGFDVPSLFEKFFPSGVNFSQLLSYFTPLTPRFYSIASSPLSSSNVIDLLVTHVAYKTNQGIYRVGLASNYLIKEAPLGSKEIRVFLNPTKHFILPDEVVSKKTPLVMIGPGTGVAPFRSFLQHVESIHTFEEGIEEANLWLIFGERHREHDFLYKEYWASLVEKGVIAFDAVFSRDGDQKEYVQHRMWLKRERIFDWVYRRAGYFYVCGDAKNMAKDVEAMLVAIIQTEGCLSHEAALEWMKTFRKSGLYRRDVY